MVAGPVVTPLMLHCCPLMEKACGMKPSSDVDRIRPPTLSSEVPLAGRVSHEGGAEPEKVWPENEVICEGRVCIESKETDVHSLP